MRSFKGLSICLFMAAALAAPSLLFAAEVGKITYSEGRVELFHPDTDKAIALREGDVISTGDAVRTKSNSRAEVTFKDKSVLRFAQNSKAIVKDYSLDKDNNRTSADILLERGKARAIVAKARQKTDFVISTPNAQGRVKGSDIIAFYQGGNSGMLVAEGKLSVISMAHPEKEITVLPGNSTLVSLGELPREPRAYLDIEKKLHEQDTFVPPSISRSGKAAEIKGFLTKMSGDVKITPKGAVSAHVANLSEVLSEGDTIETGEKGMVEIKFDNGNGMNLKPNTKVIIVRLVMDPDTGEYENKFESSMGKVKSRIENLKGKSTFEIKTPNAVCGARGTIMYTDVLPSMTRAYFDGGKGYIKSILSGMEKVMGPGQNGSAYGNGNVSDPSYTTDEERGSNDEGWDPGNGVDGYSSPENDNGADFTGEGAGTNNDNTNGTGDNGNNNGVNVPFNAVYGTGSTGGGSTTTPVMTDFSYALSGKFGGIGLDEDGLPYLSEDDNTSMTGIITASENMASQWSGTLESLVSGMVTNPSGPSDICRGTADGSTDTNGRMIGWAGGIGFSGIWKGAITSLYIDPSGTAGTMFSGILSGTSSIGPESVYSGNGDISIISMEATNILPSDLNESIISDTASGDLNAVFDGGMLTTPFTRDTKRIDGMSWGIWQDLYKGTYQNTNRLAAWSTIGGGEYNGSGINSSGYVISTFEGEDDLNSMLRVDVMASYLTYKVYGAYSGTILGKYGETDVDGGIGFGTWSEEVLAWSSKTNTRYGYFTSDDGIINTEETDSYHAIIGSPQSPFESLGTAVETHLMGKTRSEDYRTWWGYMKGASYIDSSRVKDGFIGGSISPDNLLKGIVAALYIDGNGNAGTLFGKFVGRYFPGIEMWSADGGITATKRAEGHDPDNSDAIQWWIGGYINGRFIDGEGFNTGYIKNEIDESPINIMESSECGYLGSYTTRLVKNEVAERWGIFNIELGGIYFDATDNWKLAINGDSFNSDDSRFFATINGEKWSGETIEGTVKGVWMEDAGEGYVRIGRISGAAVGDYVEVEESSGTWQAISVGEWVEESALLNENTMFGAEGFGVLDNFVNVPITEVYSSIMQGAGTLGIGAVSMDMSLYALTNDLTSGIWTALINGAYSGEVGNGWTAQVASGANVVDLTNGIWSDGQWTATVAGTVNDSAISGQAGGTYDPNGTFMGAGAGTWQQDPR